MKKRTFNKVIFAAFSCQFLSIPLFAQQQKVDTTHTYSIPEITVSDIYQTREVRSTAPLQVFSKDALKNLHALQVSDAVKHFAGVTVKDYGGIGGLKTVSIRSLGAQHTAVGYDGITLTDCQTGQIDIGRFSLDNVDRLSLNNGQSDNIFQPARFFASAGILNIQTLTPQFTKDKKTNIAGAFKTGSWGLVNPSLLLEQQFNKTWSMSANGEWMSSDGHYPYTLHYGNAAEDLSSREKRKNTDVQTFRAEAGLYGNFSDKEQWRLKAYYFQSSRGLPKATTFYNDHSTQHLWDKNTFIQSQYKKEFSRQWVFQTSAKWNWSYQRYLDPDTKNSLKKTENSYYQQEYYLSASVLYRLLSNLSFSLSTDGSINTMNADLANFVHPTRYAWLTAFAGKYVNNWLTISASALATVINEFIHLTEGKWTQKDLLTLDEMLYRVHLNTPEAQGYFENIFNNKKLSNNLFDKLKLIDRKTIADEADTTWITQVYQQQPTTLPAIFNQQVSLKNGIWDNVLTLLWCIKAAEIRPYRLQAMERQKQNWLTAIDKSPI